MLTLKLYIYQFLVVTHVCHNVKAPKIVYTPIWTKISGSVKNCAHRGKKQPWQEVGGVYTFVKSLWCLHTTRNWTYINSRKIQYYNCHKIWYLFFVFWDLSFKVCITVCFMPSFCKKHDLLLSEYKINYPVKMEFFCYIFSGYVRVT